MQLASAPAVAAGGHVHQQLEVAEDALQRVVHLVRDAGDELAERRQLLGLRQALAQRRALGLEPRLPRDVARHEHAPERAGRPALDERRRGQQERPVELRRRRRAAAPPATIALPGVRRLHVGERLGADELAQRPPHDVGPLQSDAAPRRRRSSGRCGAPCP